MNLPSERRDLIRADDSLFVYDQPAKYRRVKSNPRWVEVSNSYKSAADSLLSELAHKAQISASDLYPVLFLYRHFAEMQIKSLLLLSYVGMDEAEERMKTERVLHLHDLKRLAEEFDTSETVFEAIKRNPHYLGDDFMGRKAGEEVLDAFIETLGEMSALDPTSCMFRYPITKTLAATTPGVTGLNLGNLSQVARRLELTFGWLRSILERRIDGTVNRDLFDSEMFDPASDRRSERKAGSLRLLTDN